MAKFVTIPGHNQFWFSPIDCLFSTYHVLLAGQIADRKACNQNRVVAMLPLV